MAYEEILTTNSAINSDVSSPSTTNTIQSKRISSTNASSSSVVLKDGELLVVKTDDRPNLRVGDGSTQIKNLKDVVPGEASASSAGFMSASDKTKLDGIASGANKTTIDSALSSTSENPVQNKVINTALAGKANSSHTHNYLPLSGGTMTGALTTKGVKLTSGTDYGATLPSSPATNQLFFQTVGSNFVLDNVYPVGSIYMNVNSTNPGTLFGGTWEQIQGRFLLGTSSSYPAGSTGGEETHTLTEAEGPAHAHAMAYGPNTSGAATGFSYGIAAGSATNSAGGRGFSANLGTFSAGGGQPHNNMPPYLTVYMWYRTA